MFKKLAVDYALDQTTTLGAYYNELEFTEMNLTAANENTVSSESVIRDADMARETLNYAKHNILSQTTPSYAGERQSKLGKRARFVAMN